MKGLFVATVLLLGCAPVSSPPSASPIETNAVAPTGQATPSPTATVATGLTRYVNTELGYSVDLSPGWRRAICSQGIARSSPIEATEWFIGVPESEEIIRGGVPLLQVRVVAADGLTPRAWLEQNVSGDPNTRFENAMLNGRDGARAFSGASGSTHGFAFAARGWIYAVEWSYSGAANQELEHMLMTVRILDDATVGRSPLATAVPRTIESLADSIADAYTRKDATAIAQTMVPCITFGAIPGDPDIRSRSAYVTDLGVEFAAGTSVKVQSRPIEIDPYFGQFVRSTWSKPGDPDRRVDLMLRADGDRWSVGAVLTRTGN